MKILILILLFIDCVQANAGWFGPNNANDCIKDHADEVHSPAASQKLIVVCHQQFPSNNKESSVAYINPDFILAQKDVHGKWWRIIKDTWYVYGNGLKGWKAVWNVKGNSVPLFSNDRNDQRKILEYFGIVLNQESANVVQYGEQIEEQLRRIATETMKNLPMMVSEDLQATTIGAIGRVLIYKYNFTKRKSAIINLDSLKNQYYQNSIHAMCTNLDTLSALNNGVSMEYQYYDSINEFVMQYKIDSRVCPPK